MLNIEPFVGEAPRFDVATTTDGTYIGCIPEWSDTTLVVGVHM